MRVVVTRPAHSGERTAERLRELGHEPVLVPLAHPVHRPEAAGQALTDFGGAIAVTSAEAIRVLASLGRALAPHLERPLFAVGRTTADAARAIGFTAVHNTERSGLELAGLIGEHRALLSEIPLLYLAGSPRTPRFEARLQALSIPFVTRECYRMTDDEPSDADLRHAFLKERADAVLLYSRHTAEHFFNLPFFHGHDRALDRTKLLCLSEAVATALPDTRRKNSLIAANPDEDSLLKLLDRA
jgi:uroporphyrinogen-III synthase